MSKRVPGNSPSVGRRWSSMVILGLGQAGGPSGCHVKAWGRGRVGLASRRQQVVQVGEPILRHDGEWRIR